VVLTSPYRRALDTARLVVGAGGTARGPAFSAQDLVVDERLREKELGQFYRLTRLGVEQRHPDQWALRREVGPFYYRPPGGESWCDVVLRLRSVLDSVALHYRGERVMVVCHQIVIYCARYVLEGFGEDEVLRVAREHDVANCSVTMYDPADSGAAGIRGRFALARFNVTVPVEEEGGAVTVEPEAAGSA
jgi:broad specificity phosphatase PhoE